MSVRLLGEKEIRQLPRVRLITYRRQLRVYEEEKRSEIEALDDEVFRLSKDLRRSWGDTAIDGSILLGGLLISPISGLGGFVVAAIGLLRLTEHTMKSAFEARDALQAAVSKVSAVKVLLVEGEWRLALIERLLIQA